METVSFDCNESLLPPGHKFIPSNEEIINHYLRNKILDPETLSNLIPTVDVYSYPAPETLPFWQFRYGRKKEWYFFATRPKYDGNILTSQGYWNRKSNKEVKIIEDGKVIGFLRKLQFVYAGPTEEFKYHWFIDEYRVNPSIFEASELDDTTKEKILTTVVCQVTTKKPEENKEMKRHRTSQNRYEGDEPQKKMKI